MFPLIDVHLRVSPESIGPVRIPVAFGKRQPGNTATHLQLVQTKRGSDMRTNTSRPLTLTQWVRKLLPALTLTGATLTGLFCSAVYAAGETRMESGQVPAIAGRPAPTGSGSPPPVATSYTDLNCGGGRKLRLTGNCSVSDKNKSGVCRGFNGETDFSVSCASGCPGASAQGQSSCHDIVVQ